MYSASGLRLFSALLPHCYLLSRVNHCKVLMSTVMVIFIIDKEKKVLMLTDMGVSGEKT